MSCFVVSSSSIARMAKYISENALFPCFSGKPVETIYDELYLMNIHEYEYHYGHSEDYENFTKFELVDKKVTTPTEYEFVGHLRCYLYQCSDYNENERERTIYDELSKFFILKFNNTYTQEEKEIIKALPWE